jgi:hypothetical protein
LEAASTLSRISSWRVFSTSYFSASSFPTLDYLDSSPELDGYFTGEAGGRL